jgi:hypothetical protein
VHAAQASRTALCGACDHASMHSAMDDMATAARQRWIALTRFYKHSNKHRLR